jgi:predicted nucleic acid-binding Zn ribbon protein
VERMLADSRAEHLAQHGLNAMSFGSCSSPAPRRRPQSMRATSSSCPRSRTSAPPRTGGSAAGRRELDGYATGGSAARDQWSRDATDAPSSCANETRRSRARLLRAHDPLLRDRPRALEPDLDRGMGPRL